MDNLMSWIPSVVFSTIVIGMFGAICGLIFFYPIPDGSRDIALILIGNLSAMAMMVVGRWFSSKDGLAAISTTTTVKNETEIK